jgi:hypothetical protein
MIGETYGLVKPIAYRDNHYTDMVVYGFDTETPNHTIRLLSISDGITSTVFDITSETILDCLIDYFRQVKEDDVILFAHNLEFDFLVCLNLDLKAEFPQFLQRECHWKYLDVQIDYFNEHPHFGTLRYDNGKVVHLRDTFAYYGRIALSKLAIALKIGEKLEHDKDDFFSDKITKEFKEYAKEDARLAALIGGTIMNYHAMEDVKLSVSGPNMAMMVFRKKYVPADLELTPPNEDTIKFWELSYHGGKNGCYRQVPTEIKDVYLYDINSAYPFAMTQIPNFLGCRYIVCEKLDSIWYDMTGIYLISAESRCPFNSTFDHDFLPIKQLFEKWITSYELESLINHGCLDKLKIYKAIFVIPMEGFNPLAEYAKTYYGLKSNEPKDSPTYLYYKICALNSIYGKLIERRDSDENDYCLRGPNYNPAAASLITGHTRATMHELEHKTDAIHSATDAVFTCQEMPVSNGIGGLSCQGFGTLQMFRTKLYMFRSEKGEIVKYALHGFHGKLEQLEYLWKTKTCHYSYQKIPTAGEYFLHKKLHLKLFGMNTYNAKINIDWSLMA